MGLRAGVARVEGVEEAEEEAAEAEEEGDEEVEPGSARRSFSLKLR